MTIEAVLFDFSGTVFRLEADESWNADLTAADGRVFDLDEKAELVRRMTSPVGQFLGFDERGQYAWDNRDLDPEEHRYAYVEVLRRSGVPTLEQAERLYARSVDPACWRPYPDLAATLESLAAREIPVAIVSNIAFDIRPVFARHGWADLIHTFVLSFELGAVKPDPRIFRAALDKLGVEAAAALMVGDSAEADGGATALGCAFALVDPLPTVERPDALLSVLRANGLAS
ncbi:HAD family hydrolase [Nocardia panacis]|uniref:HAD family hydrolase n=1 Tax=Nocardia panacis TaxID=2340916 RepID=A0A3A4K2T5_9NOCA|nr:HAD family hydrolase [Nocardia panacis]RJO68316.1 HAD family hydrolase [Nocardia panacis]